MISLAEIRFRKEGRINFQWLVRDLQTALGESRPTHKQSGSPSFCALRAAEDASILAHFSHRDIGMEMDPGIGKI